MADRYWVGGTASWDGTAGTKWATTSGGAGGAAVPTSADNVFFDAASGAVLVTVSTVQANCLNLNFTGFTGTLGGNVTVSVSGNLVLAAGMTVLKTGTFTMAGTGTQTITSNGKSLSPSSLTINCTGTYSLSDALASAGIQFSQGTFTTNNNNITSNFFSSNTSLTRVLNLGSSTITLSSSSGWSITSATGLTLNSGTSQIVCTGATGVSFSGAGLTYYNVSFTGGFTGTTEGQKQITGTNTFNNLSIVPASGNCSLVLNASQIVNGTFTCTGNTVKYRIFVKSSGTSARTITAAAVSVQDTDFRNIVGAGAASPFALSSQRVGNCGGNSGITFPTPVNRYAVSAGNYSSTTMWSSTSGGASGASVPLPQDTAYFNASSGAGTYQMDFGSISNYGTIDCSGFTRTLAASTSAISNVCGSLIFSSGMTYTSSGAVYFTGIGTYSIDTQGKSFPSVSINTSETIGNYSLLSALTTVNDITIYGTFNTNNFSMTCGSLTMAGSSPISFGSSSITVTGSGGVFTSITTGTFNAGTSTIYLTDTSTTARSFTGGNKTYYDLVIGGATGTSALTIFGSNTFNTISSTKTVAHTILFQAVTTTTVANFTVDGTSGNVVTLGSNTASPATLTKTGGGSITVDYASISNLTASPSSTWYATNSTDGGGNSGWTFVSTPVGNGLLFGSNF